MRDQRTIDGIRQKFVSLSPVMDERMRRQWAASEAAALGWGGVSATVEATGLARNTIKAGMRELQYRSTHPEEPTSDRVRQPGAGRSDCGIPIRSC